MVFSNLFFIYAFLPVCLLLCFIAPNIRVKNYVLLAASLLFYGLGEPVYIFLLLIASLSAFLFARGIGGCRAVSRRRLLLAASVTVNVAFLFVFKYVPLLVETFGVLFPVETAGFPEIVLPIGISFYTFQILTYTVDIYFHKTPVQSSFAKFLLYVSLFPQLIAGPIVRYADIETQLSQRQMTAEKFSSGVVLFICGLSKKIILADQAGASADLLLRNPASMGALGVWSGVILYAFQIYFDFAGYSDMAIGLGRMFGFEFKKNFDYPYISKSVTEFWRRWHISLGTFFRDYVYIPLGGNRKAHARNIAVVWLLTGLWHGASWNFALWGLYYGLLLIVEKYVFQKIKIKLPAVFKCVYTLFAVLMGWVLFYFTDMNGIAQALRALFSFRATEPASLSLMAENFMLIIVCIIAATPLMKSLYDKGIKRISGHPLGMGADTLCKLFYVAAGLFICTARLVGSSFSPFLYFRF
ncbi:MAG: MBOAT family protein [Clostridiales bacterium]|jgi:alginate O-acetyltransferase complex protein AlgI|nr:MBOAT family protein [Clostridiales bacterium]